MYLNRENFHGKFRRKFPIELEISTHFWKKGNFGCVDEIALINIKLGINQVSEFCLFREAPAGAKLLVGLLPAEAAMSLPSRAGVRLSGAPTMGSPLLLLLLLLLEVKTEPQVLHAVWSDEQKTLRQTEQTKPMPPLSPPPSAVRWQKQDAAGSTAAGRGHRSTVRSAPDGKNANISWGSKA